jgi:probable rRNA maturation factor
MNTIEITTHCDVPSIEPAKLEALIEAICKRFHLAQVIVSVGIVDDAEMSELNERFLNHQGTTDCLSFDLSDAQDPEDRRIFDLVVNGQMAVRQAQCRGHSADAELALYVTHGLLHQLGFDDLTPEQAQEMHATEDEILQHFGYGLVYNSDAKPR